MKINILFTSVGQRGYLVRYFRDALKREGVIHAGNSEMDVAGLLAADHVIQTPLIHSENYIPFLLEYCKKNHITALIPLFDIDLTILSRHKKEFRDIGVEPIVSDPDVIEICSDKWALHNFLIQHHFHTKPSFLRLIDFNNGLYKGETVFPVIMKPRRGMGSVGVNHISSQQELEGGYQFTLKKISDTYLRYEATGGDDAVLIQEACKGEEYNLDVINDLKKNYVTTVVKKKIRMRCGETDCALTVKHDALTELGEKIGKTLRHVGNLDVDLILENGKPYIIDMNARFGGGYPFSHLAGVNMPAAIISWLKGNPADKACFSFEYGVKGIKDLVIKRV